MGVSDLQTFKAHKILAQEHELADLAKRQLNYLIDDDTSKELLVNSGFSDEDSTVEICVGPDCYDCMDDCLLFSLFRNTMVLHEKGYIYGKGEQIEVNVAATLMSRDCCASDDENDFDETRGAGEEESIFVGRVSKASEECDLRPGSLVTSLRKCPISAKVVTVPINSLISVPDQIDPGEAASIVTTFAPAMGMLFHGHVDHNDRFSECALKGKDILVTGGGTDEADAVVGVALSSGANRVFVLQSKLSMATPHAQSVRVELVSDNPEEWKPVIDRYMDVIVDLQYPKNFDALYGILRSTGRLVCRKAVKKADEYQNLCGCWRYEFKLLSYPSASIYDIDEQIENEHAEMVRDIRHLFRLLNKRRIRPSIDGYVKLRDIELFREYMRHKPESGAIVCEP